MAKQTFTTGQVLTAAQMTSLQATSMGGGSPSVKTTSYVLVAADAGTVIQMNSASSTTITVNTSLFSAGDSVQIQNIGSGTMTITAGTATVNSAGSLAVSQYDGGFLYFSSASSAIWFDYTQPGTTSPLTTKGDLYTRTSSADSRLPVGANGTTLVADSAEATGLKWATPAGGGKVLQVVSATTTTATTINTTTLTDTTLTASITPSLATSKILVLTQQHIATTRSNAYMSQVKGALLRGSTKIVDYSASAGYGKYIMYIEAIGVSSGAHVVVQNYNYLDSPATTSSTTYKTQLALDSTSASATLTAQADSVVSSIILMEIGA